jgi:predicted dehydrogenase
MTASPGRIGLLGDGPVADAYAVALDPLDGVELVRAAGAADLAGPAVAGVIAFTPEAALDVIAHGKSVLVDLPGRVTADQLGQVRAAAEGAGVAVVIARPWRFHEVARSFRTAADAGELGVPAFFHWVDEGDGGWPVGEQSNGAAAGTLAGIDLALWLLGERPARVYARETGGGGVTISLRGQGGANALVERRPGSTSGAGFGFAWLLGPRGEARWDRRADGVSVIGGQPSPPPLDAAACLQAQVAEAIARWAGAGDPASDLDEARWVARTIRAASESVRLGQPVSVATDEEGGSDA